MPLPTGSRLGPYEILAALGAGGMGEVYRAKDARLGRVVAVKVLPSAATSSEEMRQRFEREARVIAQVSHPHICALYDVGREGSTEFLVMELLEGETLADRIARGPLSLEETLRFGADIASALEAAHRAGIVHRDLKPGNVMVTASGVKLLDFGLAKVLAPGGPIESLTSAPTMQKDVTREGAILGTLSYMAPEQLEGKPADARADIFALGTVLYEMATGRKAFTGTSQASLISAILSSEPSPVSSAQPMSPPALDRLVKTCLAKDPARRWQSAHDVALQLSAIVETPLAATSARVSRGRSTRWAPWAVSLALAAAASVAAWKGRRPAANPGLVRLALRPPEKGAFYTPAEGVQTAVSPDGSRVAFVASDAEGQLRIFVRPLSDLEARPIGGTEGATSLFFSPDGRSIGFFAQDKLKRIDLAGGAAISICEVKAGIGRSGSWGATGQILFASVQSDAILRVAADGGQPEVAITLDAQRGQVRLLWPWFLPDGRRFLYVAMRSSGGGELMLAGPGVSPRSLEPIRSRVEYVAPGYLLFVREGALLAQRFDPDARSLGATFTVAPSVANFLSTGWAAFAASPTGTVAYQPHENVRHLAWFDRSGRPLGPVGSPGDYLDLSLSPDGRRVAFARALPRTGTYDVWLLDLERGVETAVTSDPEYSEFGPVWLPDGKSLLFSAQLPTTSAPQLFAKELASGRETIVLPSGGFQEALDVSRDGRILAFAERSSGGTYDLSTLALTGDRRPVRFPHRAVNAECLSFSPDGTAVAFISNESGRGEAYLAPFSSSGERIRLSPDGASILHWSRDGKEIFYLTRDGRLLSVPVRTVPTLSTGLPAALFSLTDTVKLSGPQHSWRGFDVSPDGKRFLAIVTDVMAGEQPLTVVVNWAAEGAR